MQEIGRLAGDLIKLAIEQAERAVGDFLDHDAALFALLVEADLARPQAVLVAELERGDGHLVVGHQPGLVARGFGDGDGAVVAVLVEGPVGEWGLVRVSGPVEVVLEKVVPVLLGALAIGADLHGAGVPAFGDGALHIFGGRFHACAAHVEGEDQARADGAANAL